MNTKQIRDLGVILQAQRFALSRLDATSASSEAALAFSQRDQEVIADLTRSLDDVETRQAVLSASDLASWNPAEIEALYASAKTGIASDLAMLQFDNWHQFVRDSEVYCLTHDVELTLPYDSLLTDQDRALLKMESYATQYRWDKWDYIMVGAAGALAVLTDFFLVAIPKDMPKGSQYAGQKGSVITKWLQEKKFPPHVQKWLESRAKVPYDNTGGPNHRLDTLGHDPVLGFIFGVIQLMQGGAGAQEALITQFLHLVSDVATQRGLPPPFFTLLRKLDVGAFARSNGKTATIAQLVQWMYANGYDLRHFLTMGITPATIEIILRLYIMIRHYCEKDEVKFILADNPKYRSMLLSSHAIAAAGNVGKFYLAAGNPLAVNYAEWLALLRYLAPSIKYWVLDRRRLKLAHMQQINEKGWQELVENGYELLIKTGFDDGRPPIILYPSL